MNFGTNYGGVGADTKPSKVGSFWGHYTKEKEKYYDTLTSYLLMGFIIVCAFRAFALKAQVEGLMNCVPAYGNHYNYMYSYLVFIFLFAVTFVALKKENRLFLLVSLIACGAAFLYKFIALVILAQTDELMESCYLVQNFGRWTFFVGALESLLFAFMLIRVYKGVERLSKI